MNETHNDIDIELPEHDRLYETTNENGFIDVEPAYRKSTVLRLIEADRKRIAELESANAELERLCDETYVAQGADAYNLACEEMEDWQAKRRKAGKEVGTTGSLCDGIQWLYGYIEELEAKRRGEPVAWRLAKGGKVGLISYDKKQVDTFVSHGWRVYQELYAAPQPAELVKVPSNDFAHEIWAAAQTAPGEGIEDAVERVAALLARYNDPDNRSDEPRFPGPRE